MSLSLPYTFTPGQIAASGQVMANLLAIVNYINALSIPTTPIPVASGGTGATTGPQALTNLGLGNLTLLPCVATGVGGGSPYAIACAPASNAPTISAYNNGTCLVFQSPSTITPPAGTPITVQLVGLAALTLYTPGIPATPVTALQANQLCMVLFSSALGGWVLVNAPPAGLSGVLLSNNNLSDVQNPTQSLQRLGGAFLSSFTTGLVTGNPGNQPIAGGIIFKWGPITFASSGAHTSNATVNFATPFPNNCFGVVITPVGKADPAAGGYPAAATIPGNTNVNGFTGVIDTLGFTNVNQTVNGFWIAIGD